MNIREKLLASKDKLFFLTKKLAKNKKSRYIILSILVVGVVVLSVAGGGKTEKKLSANSTATSVEETKVDMGKVSATKIFDASLEQSQEGDISSKIAGKVIQVSFNDGQTVSAGQALVKIDSTDIQNNIKSAEAQVEAAQAQLKAARSTASSSQLQVNKPRIDLNTSQNNYNRVKALYNGGAATKQDLENADAQLKTAKSALESAQASADASNSSIETQQANIQTAQTNLDTLKESLSNTVITAPTGGVITGKAVNVGQYISPGTVLGKIYTVSPIYADINLTQSDLSYAKVGTKVVFDLNGDKKNKYEGIIHSIDGAANLTSRSFKCKVQIDNKEGKLKPGVFGNVEVPTNNSKEAVTVPVKAIAGTDGSYYVFVDNNGIATKKSVTIGNFDKDNIEIKSGLKIGDSVICTNVDTLQDGDAVKSAAK